MFEYSKSYQSDLDDVLTDLNNQVDSLQQQLYDFERSNKFTEKMWECEEEFGTSDVRVALDEAWSALDSLMSAIDNIRYEYESKWDEVREEMGAPIDDEIEEEEEGC